jgi:hypothetical protein
MIKLEEEEFRTDEHFKLQQLAYPIIFLFLSKVGNATTEERGAKNQK